jgi:hypothetical protein
MGEVLGGIMYLLIILLGLIIVIGIPVAISRWVFRINDTIALLESIDQKLTKLTEDNS